MFFKRKTGEEEFQATIFIKNRHHQGYTSHQSYANFNIIEKIDGKKERHKLYRLGMPAFYVSPGKHTLTANATWHKGRGRFEKLKDSVNLEVDVSAGRFYSLNYNIDTEDFEFLECDPKKYSLVGEEFEAKIADRSFDFNFKLAIINELLDKKPSFEGRIVTYIKREKDFYFNDFELDDEKCKEFQNNALKFFEEIVFTKSDLLKVENLCFDGGLEIYHMVSPDWDGEDDLFDIHSIKGIEYLSNLKSVEYISMIDQELLDEIRDRGIKVE